MGAPVDDILDILLQRAARQSLAPHGDGARVALAIEGGAMRGVISAGMVSALEALGLTHAFDAVYGSSAGAINGAYFLAAQAGLGTTIYYEDINNRRFADLRRALIGRPIVDLGFLFDDVVRRRKPLDTARVLRGATPFSILATDVDARTAGVLRDFTDDESLFSALRASATMPVMAGEPWPHQGRRWLDASLSEPIPVPAAEADGCTHVVALLTRAGAMRARPSAFDRYFVGPRLRRLSPEIASRYLARAEPYSDVIRAIDAGRGPRGRAQVLGIRVPGLRIGKLERERRVLIDGARRGYDAVMAAFDHRQV